MIERKIIIALITSTEFIRGIQDKWSVDLFESSTAKRLATWCIEYYDKYQRAPGKEIEGIFYEKVKAGLPKELSEEIAEEILPRLSEEYEIQLESPPNVEYLIDLAKAYFNEHNLLKHADSIRALVETNKVVEAESMASAYAPMARDSGTWIDLSDFSTLIKLKKAFIKSGETLITFPGALGEFMNDLLIREGFIALQGPEKRGKTWWLLQFAKLACKQGRKVAFFQAGDMSEDEQLIRMSISLAGKSNKPKYCGSMFEPIKDCIFNQLNICKKKERECDFGIFDGKNEKWIRREVTMKDIMEQYADNADYVTCTNCKEYSKNPWGAIWYKEIDVGSALTYQEARKYWEEFFIKYNRQFKLSTHANSTLSVKESSSIMDIWEKQDNFIPDVIIYDYADIMTDPDNKEERPRQNAIWKALRGVSQKRKALVITATQADADSYERDTLALKNFSEDKRKYGHVTAMFGLNQDHTGREKKLGIMRLNEMVVREGDFNSQNQVHVLQNIRRGKPFLTSYW